MPVSAPIARGGGQPTCFDRVKLGFMMGAFVGCGAGMLFGGFSSLRAGLRGMELVGQTSKAMLQGAGTFGTFMSIGSAIRC